MRIVSMLPSATEIACTLGLREHLVGISHECDYPSGLEQLPRLTSSILEAGLSPAQIDAAVRDSRLEGRPIYLVDGRQLEALRPDLILTQGVCSVCAVTPETIDAGLRFAALDRELDVPIVSLGAVSFEGVLADIETVALAAGVEARGRACTAALRERWERVRGQAREPRPKLVFLEWPDPPWTAGHWVPEQIETAGGRDLLGQAGGESRKTDWETIARADPDWLIAGACGYDLETNLGHARALLEHPLVAGLRAVEAGRFWAVDANAMFSRPGPRVVDGAELLRSLLGEGAKASSLAAPVC